MEILNQVLVNSLCLSELQGATKTLVNLDQSVCVPGPSRIPEPQIIRETCKGKDKTNLKLVEL